jgi:coenzyme F420 biosynthesis associated uncharacterized protein
MSALIDTGTARTWAVSTTPRGPHATPEQARAVAEELAERARQSQELVAAATGLIATGQHDVVIADRPTWIDSNLRALDVMTTGLTPEVSAPMRAIGSRMTAANVGAALGWLSGHVLGQYEATDPRGRLLLVAPNIVRTESELGVEPSAFRFWVCLHEETHRVQFGAVPWLREYFLARVRLVLEPRSMPAMAGARYAFSVISQVFDALRTDAELDLVSLAPHADQREAMNDLIALMTVLEGHADVVMDIAGVGAIDDLAAIRSLFENRRDTSRDHHRIIRKLLGMDAKLRQYREGAAFISAVLDRGGMTAVNALWESPANLPTLEEIETPALWWRRVVSAAA